MSNWQPPSAIASGAVLGGALAKLIAGSLTYFAHIPIDADTKHSITVLAIFFAGWLLHYMGQPTEVQTVPSNPTQPADPAKVNVP